MSGLFGKLKAALTKTSSKISQGIDHVFFKKRLDENALEELEDILISSDVGVGVAANIVENLRNKKFAQEVSSEEIRQEVASVIEQKLEVVDHQFTLDFTQGLQVILICGVNGNGKTTSIGKLANIYKAKGKKVAVAACDTFRAAAVAQLEEWTNRAGVVLFKGAEKADPASVAHIAVEESLKNKVDILFIDTAGRLHNHKNLMDELAKIIRVISRQIPEAPHHALLVVDGTNGQNALIQTEEFKNIANISGLVITKLDGTAKAGVVVGIVDKFKLPIHFIGIGENITDLKEFNHIDFSKALVG
jgi:fused signal recognition particle receptor